jgi:hypothetical protein
MAESMTRRLNGMPLPAACRNQPAGTRTHSSVRVADRIVRRSWGDTVAENLSHAGGDAARQEAK